MNTGIIWQVHQDGSEGLLESEKIQMIYRELDRKCCPTMRGSDPPVAGGYATSKGKVWL